jgi:DNA-binding NtrC family response regulator
MHAEDVNLCIIRAGDISEAWLRAMRQRIERSVGAARMDIQVIENIDTLPVDLQSQLLPMMEGPLHEDASGRRRRSVRFVTLADTDLERLCREGRFRKDLYHRLSVFKVAVPPLRHRPDDVPALTNFFSTRYSILKRRSIFRPSAQMRSLLQAYHWPGNVAELERAIEDVLLRPPTHWEEGLAAWARTRVGTFNGQPVRTAMTVKEDVRKLMKDNGDLSLKKMKQLYAMKVETKILKAALFQTNGNCKKAAGMLRISYKSMLNKAKDYGLVGIWWMGLIGCIGLIS